MLGLIYLGSVLTLTFLIGLGQRDHHSELGGQQVFRFPRVLVTALKVCIAVPGVLGIAVYQSVLKPGILEATFCRGIFGALTLIVIASYYQSSRFAVAVGPLNLTLHTGSRSQEISLSGAEHRYHAPGIAASKLQRALRVDVHGSPHAADYQCFHSDGV
jgi:hypothetical protein